MPWSYVLGHGPALGLMVASCHDILSNMLFDHSLWVSMSFIKRKTALSDSSIFSDSWALHWTEPCVSPLWDWSFRDSRKLTPLIFHKNLSGLKQVGVEKLGFVNHLVWLSYFMFNGLTFTLIFAIKTQSLSGPTSVLELIPGLHLFSLRASRDLTHHTLLPCHYGQVDFASAWAHRIGAKGKGAASWKRAEGMELSEDLTLEGGVYWVNVIAFLIQKKRMNSAKCQKNYLSPTQLSYSGCSRHSPSKTQFSLLH